MAAHFQHVSKLKHELRLQAYLVIMGTPSSTVDEGRLRSCGQVVIELVPHFLAQEVFEWRGYRKVNKFKLLVKENRR